MIKTTRRSFIITLTGSAAAFALARPLWGSDRIRVGMIVPAGHTGTTSVISGARLGEKEAKRTAELMKRHFELSISEVAGAEEAATEAAKMRRDGIGVIAGGLSAWCCQELGRVIPESFLEIRDRQEVPDVERARHLRVTPSKVDYTRALLSRMKRQKLSKVAFDSADALSRTIARQEGLVETAAADADFFFTTSDTPERSALTAGVCLRPAQGTAVPLAWHPALYRYGAGELNERYEDATGIGMNENAWFGWTAMKIVLETALRNQQLADARIDGHKGVPLTFRRGILQQPLYVAFHSGDEVKILDA